MSFELVVWDYKPPECSILLISNGHVVLRCAKCRGVAILSLSQIQRHWPHMKLEQRYKLIDEIGVVSIAALRDGAVLQRVGGWVGAQTLDPLPLSAAKEPDPDSSAIINTVSPVSRRAYSKIPAVRRRNVKLSSSVRARSDGANELAEIGSGESHAQ